ncbi:MAG: hypothetical protein GY952_04350 [Rhodobacteraceae bacterium]|nr:hypothetical protein [Paracoccaceae bacterium]
MTFIRPEVRALLWRWREVAVTGLATLWGIRILGNGVDQASVTTTIFGIALASVAAALLFLAILRVKFHKPTRAEGVVEVTERQVGYLGPDTGSYVSLDDLTRLEIVTSDKGPYEDDVFWILTHHGGAPLMIPASAEGTDQLFDAFSALPGIRFEEAIKAMGSTKNARFLIWEK